MIKNVIFDFGQVLVRFEPSYMVRKYVTDERDSMLLAEVIFDRLYWDRLDAGTISDADVIKACKSRVPERLRDDIEKIYRNWIYNIPEIEGMRELIKDLKTRHGVGLYLLSNISAYFADHAGEIPILGLFDGCVFSAVCGKTKPSREIFEHITSTYSLLPEECVFIDDSEKNVRGAEEFGINAILFDGNVKKLIRELEGMLSKK